MNTNRIGVFEWRALVIAVLVSINCSVKADSNVPVIPTGAKGLVIIDSVHNGNLLHMRGWAGEGRYLTLNEQGLVCIIDSIEFIAGVFTDTNISIVNVEPIKIAIYSETVSQRLISDQQVSSKDYQIEYEGGVDTFEMKVINGVVPSMTFILNPKRTWTSWFREDSMPQKCI